VARFGAEIDALASHLVLLDPNLGNYVRRAPAPWSPPVGFDSRDQLVALLKEGLSDSNKRVRTWAAEALVNLDVDDERMRADLVPAVLPLLHDPTRLVRRRVAYELQQWADHVPLEVAARALADETNAGVRGQMAELVRLIIEAKEAKAQAEAD